MKKNVLLQDIANDLQLEIYNNNNNNNNNDDDVDDGEVRTMISANEIRNQQQQFFDRLLGEEEEEFNKCFEVLMTPVTDVLHKELSYYDDDDGEFKNENNTNNEKSNKEIAQRKRFIEKTLKYTKTVIEKLSPRVENEFKVDLFRDLVSLLQVQVVKETEELCLATNGLIEAVLNTWDLQQQQQQQQSSIIGDEDGAKKTIHSFTNPSFAPILGFAISNFLEMTNQKNKQRKNLRSSSLKVLHKLVHLVQDAQTLAFFLPGVVSALVRLLHSEITSSASDKDDKATEHCLSCLSEIICFVLGDEFNRNFLVQSTTTNLHHRVFANSDYYSIKDSSIRLDQLMSNSSSTAEDKRSITGLLDEEDRARSSITGGSSSRERNSNNRSLTIERTKEWFDETVLKVVSVLNSTMPLFVKHARASVRKACATCCAQILEHCKDALFKSQRTLLQNLMSLSNDTWELVSSHSKAELKCLKDKKLVPIETLKDILKEDLLLSSSFGSQNGSDFSSAIPGLDERILATIDLLGSDETSEVLLLKTSTRRELVHALAQRCGGDSENIKFREILRKIGETAVMNVRSDRNPIELFVNDILTPISTYPDGAISSYVFVLNEVLLGTIMKKISNTNDLLVVTNVCSPEAMKKVTLDLIIDEYVSKFDSLSKCIRLIDQEAAGFNNFSVSKHRHYYSESPSFLIDSTNNDVKRTQKLLLEGLAVAAKTLGSYHVRNSAYFSKVLCIFLESSGHSEKIISEAALEALQSVCLSAGYANVTELIHDNCDFVVDLLVRQLRHLDAHPRAPQLFRTVLRMNSVDDKLIEEPLSVSLQLLRVTRRGLFSEHSIILLNCFKEVLFACERNKSIAQDILLYSSALLESFDFKVRAITCEIVSKALLNLHNLVGNFEENVNVLPLVHSLWPHLVHSFRLHYHKSLLILLKVIAQVSQSGKFIRRRVYTDLWPIIQREDSGLTADEFINELSDFPDCIADCVLNISSISYSMLPNGQRALHDIDIDRFWLLRYLEEDNIRNGQARHEEGSGGKLIIKNDLQVLLM